jgi:hypothetical protein
MIACLRQRYIQSLEERFSIRISVQGSYRSWLYPTYHLNEVERLLKDDPSGELLRRRITSDASQNPLPRE